MPKFSRHPDFEPLKSTLVASRRTTEPAVFLYKNPKGEFFLHEVVGVRSLIGYFSVEPISREEAQLRYPTFSEHNLSFDDAFPDVNAVDYLEVMNQILKSIQEIQRESSSGGVGDLLNLIHLHSDLLELLVKEARQRRRVLKH